MRSNGRLDAAGPQDQDRTMGAFAAPARSRPVDRFGSTSVEFGAGEPPLDGQPASVGIRELARNVSSVVADVVRSGRPVLVTKHGAPFAAIVPIERGEETVLAQAAQHLEEMAAEDLRTGRTRSAADVFAELARLARALARATSDEDDTSA